jgi:hypothetical protein
MYQASRGKAAGHDDSSCEHNSSMLTLDFDMTSFSFSFSFLKIKTCNVTVTQSNINQKKNDASLSKEEGCLLTTLEIFMHVVILV